LRSSLKKRILIGCLLLFGVLTGPLLHYEDTAW